MIFVVGYGYGQDPLFSQYNHSPMHINPAFVGLSDAPRFTLHYRNQWPNIASFNTYTTYSFTYDQFYKKINSGFGLQLLADNAGNGFLSSQKIAGTYGYQVKLSKTGSYLKGGLELGVGRTYYAWDKYIFGNQIDPKTGAISPGGTGVGNPEIVPDNFSRVYLDIGTGILFYNPLYFIGFSIKHINTPDNSILKVNESSYSGIPARFVVHAGYEYKFSSRSRAQHSFNPSIMYVRQAGFNQLMLGTNYHFQTFFMGAYYRNSRLTSDAIIGILGFKKDIYRISYSFDFTVSDLTISQGGSHEIAFGINLASNPKKQPVKTDCFDGFR